MRRGLYLVLIAVFAMPALARQQSAAELFNRGLLLERAEGKLAEAIVLYERVVTEFPKDQDNVPKALYRLGLAYEVNGDPRSSAMFSRLIKEFGKSQYAADAERQLTRGQTPPFKSRDVSQLVPFAGPLALTPDGRRAAYTSLENGQGRIHVRDLGDGRERVANVGPPANTNMRFSPDGRRLAVFRVAGRGNPLPPTKVTVVEVGSQLTLTEVDVAPVFVQASQEIGAMPWSPDGQWLPIVAPGSDPKVGEVALWSVAARKTRPLGVLVDAPAPSRWLRDGRRFAFLAKNSAAGSADVRVFSLATGQVHTVAGSTGFTSAGRITTNDLLVLRKPAPGAQGTLEVFVLDLNRGGAVKVCTEPPAGDRCQISADGRFVVRRSAETKNYFIREIPSGTERPLTRSSGDEQNLIISEDGRLAYFFSNRSGRWGLYVATLDRTPILEPLRIADLVQAPDAGLIAPLMIVTSSGVLLRYRDQESNLARLNLDPTTGRALPGAVLERLTQDFEESRHAVISPDGRSIAFSYGQSAEAGIAVMDASGANERRIGVQGRPLFWRTASEILISQRRDNQSWIVAFDIKSGNVTPIREVGTGGWDYVPGTHEVLSATDGPKNVIPVFRVMSLATGVERTLKPDTRVGDYLDVWQVSPNGKHVAYSVLRGPDTELRMMNLDGTGERVLLPLSRTELGPSAWSADGRFLLYDPDYEGVRASVMDVATRQTWPLLPSRLGWLGFGSWAPDGSFIIMATSEFRNVWESFQGITHDAVSKLMKR